MHSVERRAEISLPPPCLACVGNRINNEPGGLFGPPRHLSPFCELWVHSRTDAQPGSSESGPADSFSGRSFPIIPHFPHYQVQRHLVLLALFLTRNLPPSKRLEAASEITIVTLTGKKKKKKRCNILSKRFTGRVKKGPGGAGQRAGVGVPLGKEGSHRAPRSGPLSPPPPPEPSSGLAAAAAKPEFGSLLVSSARAAPLLRKIFLFYFNVGLKLMS